MESFFYRAPQGEPKALAWEGSTTMFVGVEPVLNIFLCYV